MGRFHDRMDEDLRIRGYSVNTRASYLRRVRHFVRHFMRPPDQLTPEHIRRYQLYLTRDRRVSWTYFNQIVCALRFFYRQVLKKDWAVEQIPYQRTGRTLPETLSPQEVAALFRATPNLKHRALLMTMYAGGLRVCEVTHLRPRTRRIAGTPGTRARRTAAGPPRRRPPQPRAGRLPGARRRPDGARCARRLGADTRARHIPCLWVARPRRPAHAQRWIRRLRPPPLRRCRGRLHARARHPRSWPGPRDSGGDRVAEQPGGALPDPGAQRPGRAALQAHARHPREISRPGASTRRHHAQQPGGGLWRPGALGGRGPDHPTLAGLLENYAGVLRRARRDVEALEIDGRARDIRARHALQNPRR